MAAAGAPAEPTLRAKLKYVCSHGQLLSKPQRIQVLTIIKNQVESGDGAEDTLGQYVTELSADCAVNLSALQADGHEEVLDKIYNIVHFQVERLSVPAGESGMS